MTQSSSKETSKKTKSSRPRRTAKPGRNANAPLATQAPPQVPTPQAPEPARTAGNVDDFGFGLHDMEVEPAPTVLKTTKSKDDIEPQPEPGNTTTETKPTAKRQRRTRTRRKTEPQAQAPAAESPPTPAVEPIPQAEPPPTPLGGFDTPPPKPAVVPQGDAAGNGDIAAFEEREQIWEPLQAEPGTARLSPESSDRQGENDGQAGQLREGRRRRRRRRGRRGGDREAGQNANGTPGGGDGRGGKSAIQQTHRSGQAHTPHTVPAPEHRDHGGRPAPTHDQRPRDGRSAPGHDHRGRDAHAPSKHEGRPREDRLPIGHDQREKNHRLDQPATPPAPSREGKAHTLRAIKPDERAMLINVAEGEECRIAIVHQNRLEELFIERDSSASHVGNIYKGRVTNVEPSIQAAFIDFGLPKNGFLHISDLQPQYFPDGMRGIEDIGRKTPRRDRPPIQKCLRRGQEVIVQIIKEGIGTKGPTLTTYVSIPGRYLVMMPGMNRLGVSRRIEDEEARRKMRRLLDELDLPKDMGFILRTAGQDQTKRELQRDLTYLQRLWNVVARRVKSDRAPCELYQESDLVIRTIRDVYSSEFNRVIVDCTKTAQKVRDFLSIAMPRGGSEVEEYSGHEPLFHRFSIEQEIERLYSRVVPLPSGGSLIIDSTEALVAIDVNSGRFRDHDDAEETAFRTNMEAADEIARHLRLRDLGGLILCDFIDMRTDKHRREVERCLRDALKKHKERAKCLRMSQFGIIEITRQRMRPSIKKSIYQDCPHCHGTGLIKNAESMTLDVIRLLAVATHHEQVERVSVRVPPSVAFHLQNHKRAKIFAMEQDTGIRITIHGDSHLGPDQYLFECLDQRGGVVRVIDVPEAPSRQRDVHGKRSRPAEPERNDDDSRFEEMVD